MVKIEWTDSLRTIPVYFHYYLEPSNPLSEGFVYFRPYTFTYYVRPSFSYQTKTSKWVSIKFKQRSGRSGRVHDITCKVTFTRL